MLATAEGVDPLPGATNYLLGDDPSRWRTGIVSFATARYVGVVPGVDLVYYGAGRDVEYDFVVAPGADPAAIRLAVEGAERVRVDESGDLVLSVAGGELRLRAPAIYQEGPGGRERVAGGYEVRGDVVTFAVGAYDPARPLVLDPVIAYSRSLGSGSWDWAEGITVGADGSAYVTGMTSSRRGFPLRTPLQNRGGGFDDAFVTKLDPSGTGLVYSTYFGGAGSDQGYAIAVGTDGSA
jgi:hypothetical protein